MKTILKKEKEIERVWHIIDATGRPLGEVAAKVASLVRGKHKTYYAPHQQTGDFVVVTNATKAVVTGNKATDKMYYQHSHFPGGMKSFSYEKLLVRHPEAPMQRAIKGMLPRGPLGYSMLRAVKIYADDRHPHAAQQPKPYTW
jgi:large subunit ribosomal protein L13